MHFPTFYLALLTVSNLGIAVLPCDAIRLTAISADFAPQFSKKGYPTFIKLTEAITRWAWYTKSNEKKEAQQCPKMLRLQLQKD